MSLRAIGMSSALTGAHVSMAIALAAILANRASAVGGDDIDLRAVLSAHKASREQIHSARAKVNSRSKIYGGIQTSEAEWWHDGSLYRVAVTSRNENSPDPELRLSRREFGYFKGAPCAVTRSNSTKTKDQALLNSEESLTNFGSIWNAGLCWFKNRYGWYYEDEFAGVRGMKDVRAQRVQDIIRVTGRSEDVWCDVDFDPKRGYIITRVASGLGESRPYVAEAKVVSEIAPGVFFPTHVYIDLPTMKGYQESKIEFLAVNQPIADSDLQIALSGGTQVHDLATRAIYAIDGNGAPTGKTNYLPPETAPRSVQGVVPDVSMPTSVPTNVARLATSIALLLGIGGASLLLLRRFRAVC